MRFRRYQEKGMVSLPSLLGDSEPGEIEEEHVAGRKHDAKLIAPVSTKDQRRVTRNREAARVSMSHEKDPIRRIALALKATSIFFELFSESLWEWGETLEKESDKWN